MCTALNVVRYDIFHSYLILPMQVNKEINLAINIFFLSFLTFNIINCVPDTSSAVIVCLNMNLMLVQICCDFNYIKYCNGLINGKFIINLLIYFVYKVLRSARCYVLNIIMLGLCKQAAAL